MAFYLNRSQILGNVTAAPEVRQTAGGQMVVTFSVATNRSWVDKNGQRQEKADFHNIVVWGKLAELASQHISKGSKIYVEGRLEYREWEGDDGKKRNKTEIVAENIIFLDWKASGGKSFSAEDSQYGGSSSYGASSAPAKQSANAVEEESVSIDDLPF